MLTFLNINGLSLINNISSEFDKGFSVITGETGAGKSVILDSILISLGERNSTLLSKQGQTAIVISEFDISKNKKIQELLQENDFEPADTLIARRTINSSGKSQVFLNDKLVTTGFIKKLSQYLIEIYSQHDSSGLLQKSSHLEILDDFSALDKDLKELKIKFNTYRQKCTELENTKIEAEKTFREEEYIRYALKELEDFNIQAGEENELAEKRLLLQQSAKITDGINSVISEFENAEMRSIMLSSQKSIAKTTSLVEGKIREKLEKASAELDKAQESAFEFLGILEEISDEISGGKYDLEKIEDRFFAIKELARKYRMSSDELADYAQELSKKLETITSFDTVIMHLQKEIEKAENEYLTAAEKVSSIRKKKAKELEKKISNELPELKMPNCRFIVEFSIKDKNNWNDFGIDNISFKVSTNPGQPFLDIGKVASGGELSRLMLAFKIALSKSNSAPTVIFDEIDTGISGSTADAVGKRLLKLSEELQVICITHQPQVSSKADSHYKVEKTTTSKTTEINLKKLTRKEANEEVARMISGEEITKEARMVASKLKAV